MGFSTADEKLAQPQALKGLAAVGKGKVRTSDVTGMDWSLGGTALLAAHAPVWKNTKDPSEADIIATLPQPGQCGMQHLIALCCLEEYIIQLHPVPAGRPSTGRVKMHPIPLFLG